MNKKYLAYFLALFFLQGCTTLSSDSKSIVLSPEPGQSEVVVTSVATSKCTEFFGNMNCDISIDLQQAHREAPQTTTTQSATVPSTQPQSTQSKLNPSNKNALERLRAIDELKNNNMISNDEYKAKRQQIMNEI